MSKSLGLYDECASKLGDNPDSKDSIFNAIVDLFNYLPVAAIVKDSILCVHSGISDGATIDSINSIKKPYSPETNKVIADILWSQPSVYKEDYTVNNYSTQFRKLNFSADSLNKFLSDNKLSMLVRTKDWCNAGFDRQFNGKVTTIFTATNYCGTQGNDGSVLYVKRNLEMQPKLMTSDENSSTWGTKKESLALYPSSPKKTVKS